MKIKVSDIDFSFGIPFLAAATFFLAGGMRENYICAVLFSSLHEIGHIIALFYFGVKPKKITLGVMGIRIEANNSALSYREECITALCGPVVNLIFAVIFAFAEISELSFTVNTGLFVINMLPVKTLDGGRFIYNFILSVADEEKAIKVMKKLEILTVLTLIAVLVFSLVTGYLNTSFVLFSVFLVIIIVSEFLFGKQYSTCG